MSGPSRPSAYCSERCEWYHVEPYWVTREAVGQRVAGRDGALRHARHTVVLDGPELPDAVPVDGRAVLLEVVGHVDHQRVAPVGDERGAGDGAVEGQTGALVAVRRAGHVLHREPVLARDARIRCHVVVVGVDGEVAPAPARRGRVFAVGRVGRLARFEIGKQLTGRERKGPSGRSEDEERGTSDFMVPIF